MLQEVSKYIPKHRTIAAQLRQQIQDGQYFRNQSFPSEPELARQLNTSRSTVRDALDILVRDRILYRQRGVGTFVTEDIGGIKTTTFIFSYANAYSLVLPYLSRIYKSFDTAVSEYSKSSGRPLSVQCVRIGHQCIGENVDKEQYSILHSEDQIQAHVTNPQFVQGICLTVGIGADELRELQNRGIACVLLGGIKRKNQRYYVPSIHLNPLAPIKVGISYLRQLGHQDIGLVITEMMLNLRHSNSCEITSEERMLLCGEYQAICADWDRSQAFEATMKLLKRPDRPTALFCEDDFMALGARDAAYKMGLSVPGDISIVGTGDFTPGAGLTTVNIPLEKMSHTAANVLSGIVFDDSGNPRDFDMDDCELIVRQSTGKAP